MPIVFEEVRGEVTPEQGRDDGRDEPAAAAQAGPDIAEKVRAVLAHERRRAERLSDR